MIQVEFGKYGVDNSKSDKKVFFFNFLPLKYGHVVNHGLSLKQFGYTESLKMVERTQDSCKTEEVEMQGIAIGLKILTVFLKNREELKLNNFLNGESEANSRSMLTDKDSRVAHSSNISIKKFKNFEQLKLDIFNKNKIKPALKPISHARNFLNTEDDKLTNASFSNMSFASRDNASMRTNDLTYRLKKSVLVEDRLMPLLKKQRKELKHSRGNNKPKYDVMDLRLHSMTAEDRNSCEKKANKFEKKLFDMMKNLEDKYSGGPSIPRYKIISPLVERSNKILVDVENDKHSENLKNVNSLIEKIGSSKKPGKNSLQEKISKIKKLINNSPGKSREADKMQMINHSPNNNTIFGSIFGLTTVEDSEIPDQNILMLSKSQKKGEKSSNQSTFRRKKEKKFEMIRERLGKIKSRGNNDDLIDYELSEGETSFNHKNSM